MEQPKAQIIKYKCCGKVFAACTEPHCYEDSDWQKDLRKYIKQGHTVETVQRAGFEFGECKCPKDEVKNQLKMF